MGRVKIRAALALVVALHIPVAASAQERAPLWVVPPPNEVDVAARLALASPETLVGNDYFFKEPKQILSDKAKTWIIVGAIVGGVLIIAGVLVLSKPGKKLFKD
jgi:hypothetical protein